MAASDFFTVTLTPGTTWAPADAATDSKLNLTANPTVAVSGSIRKATDVSATAPTATGQVLYWNAATSLWTPSAAPSPANSTVYLGGDGNFYSVSNFSNNTSLFNYMFLT